MARIHPPTRQIHVRWVLAGSSALDLDTVFSSLVSLRPATTIDSGVDAPGALLQLGDLGGYRIVVSLFALHVPTRHTRLFNQLVGNADCVIGLVDARTPDPAANLAVLSAMPDHVAWMHSSARGAHEPAMLDARYGVKGLRVGSLDPEGLSEVWDTFEARTLASMAPLERVRSRA